jgi:hypothetical protein
LDGEAFVPKATGFLVSYLQSGFRFVHLVTAEHVIAMLTAKGHDIYIRVNIKGGAARHFKIDSREFYYHPQNEVEPTDVAVCPIHSHVLKDGDGATLEADTSYLPINGSESLAVTDAELTANKVGLGDEIAIIGLFRTHFGKERNVPIVRMGRLAAMRGEPVWTRYAGYIDAYLAEVMSIGGLSGSPALAYLPENRNSRPLRLFGLVHGHFDVQNLNEDVVLDSDGSKAGIHTGLGVIIPFNKILETIEGPDLVAIRDRKVKEMRSRGEGAVADFDAELPAHRSTDENPTHLEDFTRLVDVAARKKEKK